MIDWSSNSSLLELPAIGPPESGNRRFFYEAEGFGNENDEDYENHDPAWGSGGGDRNVSSRKSVGASAANDWFKATSHGRDNSTGRSKQSSSDQGPGWEETYACKRSVARRGLHRRISPADVGRNVELDCLFCPDGDI